MIAAADSMIRVIHRGPDAPRLAIPDSATRAETSLMPPPIPQTTKTPTADVSTPSYVHDPKPTKPPAAAVAATAAAGAAGETGDELPDDYSPAHGREEPGFDVVSQLLFV